MNREIDKIIALKNVVDDNDKWSIDNIVETFSNSFKQMISDTRKYLMSGENTEHDFTEAIQGMNELIVIANKTGREEFIFPELKNSEDAKVYLLKFGKEVIKGN